MCVLLCIQIVYILWFRIVCLFSICNSIHNNDDHVWYGKGLNHIEFKITLFVFICTISVDTHK
jgi:hypothetical protein